MNRFASLLLLVAACHEASDDMLESEGVLASELGVRGYHVIKLPGAAGAGNGINNLGRINGTSDASGNTHATAWLVGQRLDLGSLAVPAGQSASVWPVKNIRGVISGITEVPGEDPNNEAWSCSAFISKTPGHVCRGFVWEHGEMRALPTLGGTHGFATGTNNRRQTVGWAENTVRDATCNQVDQFLQFRAVVWGPGKGDIRELPRVAGYTTSAATAINDRGQVAGISGHCANSVGGASAIHTVIWEPDGTITDLGNLGGEAWNTAMSINERGDVVGFANAEGTSPPTAFNYRPFLWTKQLGSMHELPTLPGDTRGQALGINIRRQIVGMSRGAGFRGVIWHGDHVTDLNTLIVSGSRDTITSANDINDLGMLTGTSVDGNGAQSAFLAIPVL